MEECKTTLSWSDQIEVVGIRHTIFSMVHRLHTAYTSLTRSKYTQPLRTTNTLEKENPNYRQECYLSQISNRKRWRTINHLLAAWRACPCLFDPGIAAIRILLFGSRLIGTSIRPEDWEGTPEVRLMYTLSIVCSLNCSDKWAWECSSCHGHAIQRATLNRLCFAC